MNEAGSNAKEAVYDLTVRYGTVSGWSIIGGSHRISTPPDEDEYAGGRQFLELVRAARSPSRLELILKTACELHGKEGYGNSDWPGNIVHDARLIVDEIERQEGLKP